MEVFTFFSEIVVYLIFETGFSVLFVLYLDDKYPQAKSDVKDEDEERVPIIYI